MWREIDILLIGGGEKGVAWVDQQDSSGVLCLDCDPNLHQSPYLLHRDALNTELRSGSVKNIQAVCLLNAVFPSGIDETQVIERSEWLQDPRFPEEVRKWYKNEFLSSFEPFVHHMVHVRQMIRAAALREMWRILAPGGEIVIIDKREIIEWIESDIDKLIPSFPGKIQLRRSNITNDDISRSCARTLHQLDQWPNAVKKIIIAKTGAR